MANNALDNATGTVFVDYVRKARPKMRESSVLQGDHWRIGILTESLIRFEWSDSGEFEDNLTQMVVNRDFGADPQFTVTHRDGLLIVDTPALYVTYDGKPFSKEGLSVASRAWPTPSSIRGITATNRSIILKAPRARSTRRTAKFLWTMV